MLNKEKFSVSIAFNNQHIFNFTLMRSEFVFFPLKQIMNIFIELDSNNVCSVFNSNKLIFQKFAVEIFFYVLTTLKLTNNKNMININ